jgi:hypothetical protein
VQLWRAEGQINVMMMMMIIIIIIIQLIILLADSTARGPISKTAETMHDTHKQQLMRAHQRL